jgi:hypothetical protein
VTAPSEELGKTTSSTTKSPGHHAAAPPSVPETLETAASGINNPRCRRNGAPVVTRPDTRCWQAIAGVSGNGHVICDTLCSQCLLRSRCGIAEQIRPKQFLGDTGLFSLLKDVAARLLLSCLRLRAANSQPFSSGSPGDRMACGSVSGYSCSSRGFIVTVKNIGAQAAIVGALAATAMGIGTGVANADQPVPSSPGMTWKLDRDDWEDWDDWNDGWRGGPRWNGPPAQCGAGYWVPPAVWQWVPPAAWGC